MERVTRDFPGRKMPAWIAPDGTWLTCPEDKGWPEIEGAWIVKTGYIHDDEKGEKIREDLKLSGGPLWQKALKDYYAAVQALLFEGYVLMEWDHHSASNGLICIRRGSEITPEQRAVLSKYWIPDVIEWKKGYYPNAFYVSYAYDMNYLKELFIEEYDRVIEWQKKRAAKRATEGES